MLDGAVLGALLARVRPDVKVMTNFLLEGVPELEPVLHLRRPAAHFEIPGTESPRIERLCGMAAGRRHAGSLSRRRGFALAVAAGVGGRSALERHCRAPDSQDRRGGPARLFLRTEQRRLPVDGDASSPAAPGLPAAGIPATTGTRGRSAHRQCHWHRGDGGNSRRSPCDRISALAHVPFGGTRKDARPPSFSPLRASQEA